MLDILLDTIIDSLKLLPFLFIAYLIMEYIEHKISGKSKEKIKKSGKFGPAIGSFFGIFPQCGFSAVATNFYAARIITLGTLISVYLSTSDEMLPILIRKSSSNKHNTRNTCYKICLWNDLWFFNRFSFKNKK